MHIHSPSRRQTRSVCASQIIFYLFQDTNTSPFQQTHRPHCPVLSTALLTFFSSRRFPRLVVSLFWLPRHSGDTTVFATNSVVIFQIQLKLAKNRRFRFYPDVRANNEHCALSPCSFHTEMLWIINSLLDYNAELGPSSVLRQHPTALFQQNCCSIACTKRSCC